MWTCPVDAAKELCLLQSTDADGLLALSIGPDRFSMAAGVRNPGDVADTPATQYLLL